MKYFEKLDCYITVINVGGEGRNLASKVTEAMLKGKQERRSLQDSQMFLDSARLIKCVNAQCKVQP